MQIHSNFLKLNGYRVPNRTPPRKKDDNGGGGINDILKVELTTGRTLPAYRNNSAARNDSCERTLRSTNRSDKRG